MARSGKSRKVQFNFKIEESVAAFLRKMAAENRIPVGGLLEWMAGHAMRQAGLKLPERYARAIRLRAVKNMTTEGAELDAAMETLSPHLEQMYRDELEYLCNNPDDS